MPPKHQETIFVPLFPQRNKPDKPIPLSDNQFFMLIDMTDPSTIPKVGEIYSIKGYTDSLKVVEVRTDGALFEKQPDINKRTLIK